MKICVISAQVFAVPPPGYSGLEMIAWQTAKELAQRGHAVTLIAPDGSTCPNVQMFHTGEAGKIDESVAFSKYKDILKDYDCIISHNWSKWEYIAKAQGLKVPVLGVCHAPINTMYQTLPDVEKPCFVCISKDQQNHFEAFHGREARFCYNGVDVDFYKNMNLKRNDRFLFLARFSSIKGPDIAINACSELNLPLDLVGDTSITNEPHYFENCKSRCDGNLIKMIGGVNRNLTVWYYSQNKCMLHPNKRFREPFGLAPVESQNCGTPVIAFDYGAMRETILHGVTGILVKTEQEFKEAVRDFDPNRFDKKKIRDWASQFSVQRMVERYEELCKEAIDTGGW